MDDLQHDIARNLKKIRLQKGLSLDQAAACTGVSKSMLAQIEREKSNPTISTLWKIATGLQISFSSFMEKEDTAIEKVSFKKLTAAIDDREMYRVYSLFPFHPEKKFEIYSAHLASGSVHHAEAHSGEEYLLIAAGAISLTVHGKTQVLETGDALHFVPNEAHDYTNNGAQEAVFFDLIYYPQ